MKNMSDDSLQYLPMERWDELEKWFTADWPRGVPALAALETQKRLETLGLGYGFKVYCPYGQPANGMVASNKKGELNEIIIHCPNDDTKKLEKSLIKSRIIDWNETILIPYMPDNIMKCVSEVAKELNLDIEAEDTVPNIMFLLHKDTPLFESNCIPNNITIQPISEKDIETIDSSWRNRFDGSLQLFTMLYQAKLGYGLYKNKELISWVFNNEVGALTHLFTLEKYRGEGYAQTLLKQFCNICLKERKNVFAYCRSGNVSASKLYKKLGFEMFHEVRWCYLKPQLRVQY